jgi:LysM repeat protein
MNRIGLVSLASAALALGAVGASCGADELSDGTLPPMYTTSTSTTSNETTTTVPRARYEVQAGDQLGNIARHYGVDMTELMELNGITNPDKIEVGQILDIPPPSIPVDTGIPTG